MNSKLLLKVRTVEEREKLSEEISILLHSLYRERGTGLQSALQGRVRMWVSELVREESGQNLDNVENYLKTLNENLDKFNVMTLTLAFEPTDSTVEKLIHTIRKAGDQNIILEFLYDPSVLGGAVISYKGGYRDLSLRRLYQDEYKSKSEEIMKIIYSR